VTRTILRIEEADAPGGRRINVEIAGTGDAALAIIILLRLVDGWPVGPESKAAARAMLAAIEAELGETLLSPPVVFR